MRPSRPFLLIVTAVTALLALQASLPKEWLLLRLAPLLELAQSPLTSGEDMRLWWQQQSTLRQELLKSRRMLHQQGRILAELHHLRAENRALRQQLALHQNPEFLWSTASTVAFSPDAGRRGLLLRAPGIAVDDVVIATHGLVGIVTTVQRNFAVARTILDGAIAVPVTNAQHSLSALVHGDGDALRVDLIDRAQQPSIGDILITSGAGDLYPQGIPVARVTHVAPIPGSMFVAITAIPTARWQQQHWLTIAHRSVEDPYARAKLMEEAATHAHP